jgi:two-component system response regulator HydG
MKQPRILVLDVDLAAHAAYEAAIAPLGSHELSFAKTSDEGLAFLEGETCDLAIVADDPPKVSSLDWLHAARAIDAALPVIVTSAKPTVESAAAVLRLSESDYLSKPIRAEELTASIQRLLGERRLEAEYELLRRQIERPYRFDDMIGGCPAMRKVFELIEQVAASDVDVLVHGETGTGKELVARSIHQRSRRAKGPFVPVDCGAIPEALLESEFFGHEKGTFTGAESRRIGLLEFADHGTFFLDELGELPALLQAKLLRTLQERKVRRVGGREEIDIDVRVVAATARDLEEMIRQERFRRDLFYRINVVRIDLPPLRERGDDIGLLAEYLCNRFSRSMQREIRGIAPEAYQVLAQYRWPGNVRELTNVIRRGIALAKDKLITVDELPDELVIAAGQGGAEKNASSSAHGFFAARDAHLNQFERQYFSELLARHHGDVRTAAQEAQIPRGTLYRLIKKHALDSASFK